MVGNHGVRAHATAHAETLAELVNNKAMAPVLGDFEECTLSDHALRGRPTGYKGGATSARSAINGSARRPSTPSSSCASFM